MKRVIIPLDSQVLSTAKRGDYTGVPSRGGDLGGHSRCQAATVMTMARHSEDR